MCVCLCLYIYVNLHISIFICVYIYVYICNFFTCYNTQQIHLIYYCTKMSSFNSYGSLCSIISAMAISNHVQNLLLTARRPPEPGKLSVSGSSSLDGSRPCFSTHWRAASTRFPLLPLVPSFAAISTLLPITIYGTGRPPGPPDPRGAENVPVAAISAAHFCKLVFVLLWERS